VAAGKKLIRSICRIAGVDPDASLPELVEFVNDNFDTNATAEDRPFNTASVQADFVELATAAAAMLDAGKQDAKLYKITARPPGKPAVTCLVLVG
jgi:hypothetical protein